MSWNSFSYRVGFVLISASGRCVSSMESSVSFLKEDAMLCPFVRPAHNLGLLFPIHDMSLLLW